MSAFTRQLQAPQPSSARWIDSLESRPGMVAMFRGRTKSGKLIPSKARPFLCQLEGEIFCLLPSVIDHHRRTEASPDEFSQNLFDCSFVLSLVCLCCLLLPCNCRPHSPVWLIRLTVLSLALVQLPHFVDTRSQASSFQRRHDRIFVCLKKRSFISCHP